MTQAKLIESIADDMRASVARIESATATTRNHYGRYLQVISVTAHGDKRVARIVAAALLAAGANKRGVLDALRAYTGES